MRFYGGNTKRLIKKYAAHDFDGYSPDWDRSLFILNVVARLRPGHIIYNPFNQQWEPIKTIEFIKARLSDYYKSRNVHGWYVKEFIITTTTNYFIRDIEHWHDYVRRSEQIVVFNQQVQLPLFFDGYKIRS